MKLIIPAIWILLFSFNSMGQKNPEFGEKYKRFSQPETLKLRRDTLIGWLNSFKLKSDSFHLGDSFRRGKSFPYMERRKQPQDAMVLNLPPSPDKMPNANVVTPGVDYRLKIVTPKRSDQTSKREIPQKEPK